MKLITRNVIIYLIILISLVKSENDLCSFPETVNITSGQRFQNGDIKFNDILFTKNNYQYFNYELINNTKEYVPSHIRGCICLVKTCVRFCCPKGSNLIPEYGCDNETYAPLSKELHWYEKYHAINGLQNCGEEGFYILEYDEWDLNDAGLVVVGDQNYNRNLFCISRINTTLTALICYEPDTIPDIVRSRTNAVGMVISIPFLLITLLVYALIRELRATIHGKSLICYVFGLTVGYTFMAMFQLSDINNYYLTLCTTFGFIAYFSFTSSFFWLNVISFDIWWTFGRGGENNRKYLKYSLYAWGSSTIMLIIALTAQVGGFVDKNWRPGIGEDDSCFFTERFQTEFLYLYLPLFILIGLNIIFFGMTAHKIMVAQTATRQALMMGDSRKHSKLESDKDRFSLYFRLFIIMGVTWSMEAISWAISRNSWYFYLTDISNSIQGLLIFLLFVWKPRVKKLIKKRYREIRGLPFQRQSEYATSKTTSSTLVSTKSMKLNGGRI